MLLAADLEEEIRWRNRMIYAQTYNNEMHNSTELLKTEKDDLLGIEIDEQKLLDQYEREAEPFWDAIHDAAAKRKES